jgi:hypothetical protein
MLGSLKPAVDRLRETATPTRLLYPKTPVGASAGQAVTFLSCALRSDDTDAPSQLPLSVWRLDRH